VREYSCAGCGGPFQASGKGPLPARCPKCTAVRHREQKSAGASARRADPVRGKLLREADRGRKRATRSTDEGRRRHNILMTDWRYGLGAGGFDRMLIAQSGLCACCGDPLADVVHVDHRHGHCAPERGCLECVRGLLCRHCNHAAGNVFDSPARARALAVYLEETSPTMTAPRGAASAAQRKQAAAKSGVIEFRSKSFTVSTAPKDIPIEVLESMEAGNILATTRGLLGDKQYASLREVLKTAADLNEFYALLQASFTASPGESSA
jgi:hypothetical protein